MPASTIERLGEKIIGLLERLYILLLDVLIKSITKLEETIQRVKDFDQKKIYPFFAGKKIDPSDYTIFKLQLLSAFFLILATLFIIDSIGFRVFSLLGGLVLLVSGYIIFSTIRRESRDYHAYRDFFVSYFLLGLLLAAVKIVKPILDFGFPYIHFVSIAVLGVTAIYIYFNKQYARDFTFGRVTSVKGVDLEVKLNYDIRSNVKPQKVFLRKTMNVREGDVVKVRVERGFFSLKGSKPLEIMGVEWS